MAYPMSAFLAAAILLAQPAPAAAGEGTCALRMMAVNGGVSYSHELEIAPGGRASYRGPSGKRGRGPLRDIGFNALLNEPGEGGFRLDYQVEVAGEKGIRPPFQVQGKALLRPGRQLLAASAGGWKYYLKLEDEGACGGIPDGKRPGTLDARLKCGRLSYSASFSYLANEQYTVTLYEEPREDVVRSLTIGLLPGAPAFDGTFPLQYVIRLKEGGKLLTDGSGGLLLSPDGSRARTSPGKDCSFSARVSGVKSWP